MNHLQLQSLDTFAEQIAETNHLATWLYLGAKLIDAAFWESCEQDAVQAEAWLQLPTMSSRTQEVFYAGCAAWSTWRAWCEQEEVAV